MTQPRPQGDLAMVTTTMIITSKAGVERRELQFSEGKDPEGSRGLIDRTHDSERNGRRTLVVEVARHLGRTARGNT